MRKTSRAILCERHCASGKKSQQAHIFTSTCSNTAFSSILYSTNYVQHTPYLLFELCESHSDRFYGPGSQRKDTQSN